jgi:hypothetical protein
MSYFYSEIQRSMSVKLEFCRRHPVDGLIMEGDFTSQDRIIDLAQRAASREHCPEDWEPRFRNLLQAGLLKTCTPLGSEFTLHVHKKFANIDAVLMAKKCLCYLVPILKSGSSAAIDLTNIASNCFEAWLGEFSNAIALGLAGMDIATGRLMFSMSIHHPGVLKFLQLRGRQDLGYPNVAVRLGSHSDNYCGEVWKSLVTLSHHDERIKLVPAMAARPLSGLHAAEPGQCVMPGGLFEVRANTAWMILEIDATRLTSTAYLRSQLGLCLRFADNLIDIQQWPVPALRLDALLNRRIALHIGRLGQRVANAHLSPRNFGTLRQLQRWLLLIRKSLIQESNRLARNRGAFPAFDATELIAGLTPCYGVAEASCLIRKRSMRHRHLLALSPFSLFPDNPEFEVDESWLNLLPAIGCADTLSMFGNDMRKRLRLNAWSRMLQLTGAMAAGSGDYAQCYLS